MRSIGPVLFTLFSMILSLHSQSLLSQTEAEYYQVKSRLTTPVLISPSFNQHEVFIDSPLEWTTSEDVDYSILYIADNYQLNEATIINPGTSPYQYNLEYNTRYYWKVIAVDSLGQEASSSVSNFTTISQAIDSFPWVEDFSNGFPTGWTQFRRLLSENTPQTPQFLWAPKNFGNFDLITNSSLAINLSGTINHWLITPTIDLDATLNYVSMNFDLGLTQHDLNMPTPFGINDYIAVVISTDNGVTWSNANILHEWVDVNNEEDLIYPTGRNYSISLEDYSGLIRIGFYAERSSGYEPDNDLFIDNVEFEEFEIPQETPLSITPPVINFGSILQGNDVDPMIVTVTNEGERVTSIHFCTITDENFEIVSSNIPYTLPPNSSFSLEIKPITNIIGPKSGYLRIRESAYNDYPTPYYHNAPISSDIISNLGDNHINPITLNYQEQIITQGTTTYFNSSYDFCESPSLVYKLVLPSRSIMDISLQGTSWDTELFVFNSYAQIDSAVTISDAWYYNDNEDSSGLGGHQISDLSPVYNRSLWSKMNPTDSQAGEYYILISSPSQSHGSFTLTVNLTEPQIPTILDTPQVLLITNPSHCEISWQRVDYADYYEIYASSSPEGQFELIDTTSNIFYLYYDSAEKIFFKIQAKREE
ncbi:choice-of-anchor J domain-containing protein [bacterium]|nr:choice-of-anchor J domain-containing protein [bacterium]